MTKHTGRLSLGILAAILAVSCGAPEKSVTSGTGGKPSAVLPAGPLKLEVDAALSQDGITVVEKSREPMKLILVFAATKKNHDSSNYNRVLFAADGKEISKTGISIPQFAKGSTFELEVIDDDLPMASRLVIQPLGK